MCRSVSFINLNLKMMQKQLNLNWQDYSDHFKEIIQNLLKSTNFEDVTLVCDDKTRLKAHKFVLSGCSSFFQSVIEELPQKKDSVIYLRGVLGQEMNSILQFMYYGQTTFHQDRMNEFLNVAKSLEVKGISQDVECNATDSPQNHEKNEFKESNQGENTYELEVIENQSNKEQKGHTVTEPTKYQNEKGSLCCSKCDKQFLHQQNLDRHFGKAHKGVQYPCNRCNKSFSYEINLQMHFRSFHE